MVSLAMANHLAFTPFTMKRRKKIDKELGSYLVCYKNLITGAMRDRGRPTHDLFYDHACSIKQGETKSRKDD